MNWPGTLHFALTRHDDHCPAIETQRTSDCTCREPIVELVPPAKWFAAVHRSRSERRKAERVAAKALRKAAKGGAQ